MLVEVFDGEARLVGALGACVSLLPPPQTSPLTVKLVGLEFVPLWLPWKPNETEPPFAPMVPFPDALSISGGVFDCALLTRYYGTPAGQALTPDQRTAINGHAVASTCDLWNTTFASATNPSAGCRTALSGFPIYFLGTSIAAGFAEVINYRLYGVLPLSIALPWGLNVGDMLGHIPLPAKITACSSLPAPTEVRMICRASSRNRVVCRPVPEVSVWVLA